MKLLVFGLGYSGQAIARNWPGETVGTTRTNEKAHTLREAGFDTVVFDGTLSDGLAAHLATATHIVFSASPSESGDPVLNAIPDFFARATSLKWIGYLSTVGVYGDFDGAWISEHTPPEPVSKRGQWRVDAEDKWARLAAKHNVDMAIFRLAGIYGPGRSTFDKLREGKSRRIQKEGQVFNRIHVEDIAQIVVAAAQKHATGIFNGADDEPAPPQIVVEYAAKMMGVEPPPLEPFETAEMTPMARSFYGDNKRCGNARLKKDLGVKLFYPTYREGLKAIFAQMKP